MVVLWEAALTLARRSDCLLARIIDTCRGSVDLLCEHRIISRPTLAQVTCDFDFQTTHQIRLIQSASEIFILPGPSRLHRVTLLIPSVGNTSEGVPTTNLPDRLPGKVVTFVTSRMGWMMSRLRIAPRPAICKCGRHSRTAEFSDGSTKARSALRCL